MFKRKMKKQEELTKAEEVKQDSAEAEAATDEQGSVEAGESTEETPAEEEAVETAPPTDEDRIATLERQLSEQQDRFTRLAAEFDNYKKRTSREFTNLIKSANEELIGELLEVLDNFDRAFESREKGADIEAYDKGMKLVYNRLLETLNRAGLKKFESVGEKFDPNLHDALMQVEDEEKEADTIAQEFQPGYYLNDKVLRHAKVGVVKGKE